MHYNIYTCEGVIIKRKNFSESDKIITLFSKQYGKITVLAKGIRKITSRRAGSLELFKQVNLTLHKSKGFDIVTEATSITENTGFSDNLTTLSFGYYISELIDQLTVEEEPLFEVYDGFVKALDSLSKHHDVNIQNKIVLDFANNLLINLGFLSPQKFIDTTSMPEFIEQITEKKLKSSRIMYKIS